MMDPPLECFESNLIQSIIDIGVIYFSIITLVHRLVVLISLHATFPARAFENINMFFSPHPPKDFGIAILLQLTHGNFLPS